MVNYNELKNDSNHQKDLLANEIHHNLHQQRMHQSQQKTSPIRPGNQNDQINSNNAFKIDMQQHNSNNGRFDVANYESNIDGISIDGINSFDYSSHIMNQQNQQQQQQNQQSIDSPMSNSYDVI